MTVFAPKILRIDGSTRRSSSVSRTLTDLAVATLHDQCGVIHVTQRDTEVVLETFQTRGATPADTERNTVS